MNWLRRMFHAHYWEDSCFSARGAYTVEQRCRCGAYRHYDDSYQYIRGEWQDGPHPTATELRAKESEPCS